MGGALTDAVWLFAAFLVILVAAAIVLASRRFLLERSGGTVECALRRLNVEGAPDHVGLPWHGLGHGGWRLGVLSYQRDELYWYGALGVLLRPEQVFQRRALAVVSRRPADEADTPQVTLVRAGCGFGGHRGVYGGCRANRGPRGAVFAYRHYRRPYRRGYFYRHY